MRAEITFLSPHPPLAHPSSPRRRRRPDHRPDQPAVVHPSPHTGVAHRPRTAGACRSCPVAGALEQLSVG